ncbi:MAG: hypothetical protein M5U18_02445 [Dehalococcoidia bacterium]|nr:hypothetical protein [Dehalococcoidia bacterium]
MNPNEVALAGRIIVHPGKMLVTPTGDKLLDLVVAKHGDRNVTFRVRTFGAVAEKLAKQGAKRFDPIYVMGTMMPGEWTDSESGELRRGRLLVASKAVLGSFGPRHSPARPIAKSRRKTAAELSAILGRQIGAPVELYL